VSANSGGNFTTRLAHVTFDAPSLQATDVVGRRLGAQYTNAQLSGAAAGPIVLDKLFYNLAFQAGRRTSDLQSLSTSDPFVLQRVGVAQDSVSRLLSVLGSKGIPLSTSTVPRDRLIDNVSLLGRFDWNQSPDRVGNLLESKGHDLVIAALARMPDVQLLIAGRGPDEGRLKALAASLGVAERVEFLGVLAQPRLRTLYSGADCLVLASVREGWANVLLEAMACGTPVAASDVGGTPEVVAAAEAGELMAERSADGVRRAVAALRARLPCRADTRRYAERFSWEDTTAGLLALFEGVLARQPHPWTGAVHHA